MKTTAMILTMVIGLIAGADETICQIQLAPELTTLGAIWQEAPCMSAMVSTPAQMPVEQLATKAFANWRTQCGAWPSWAKMARVICDNGDESYPRKVNR